RGEPNLQPCSQIDPLPNHWQECQRRGVASGVLQSGRLQRRLSVHSSTNSVRFKNLGVFERWASICGGVALVSYGVKKRSTAGTLLAVLGGDLIYRGTTGYSPLYNALGITPPDELLGRSASIPYRQGIRVDTSITIAKPREELYSFW